jgi:hypothetical protein
MPTILSHPEFMFLNSSSNHFNISSFPQYNNPTLIPPVQELSAISYTLSLEHMEHRHSIPWRHTRHMVNVLKISPSMADHSHFTTPIPHSFHLSRIICYFLHSSPGAYGLQAQFPWRHTRPMVNILKITQWMTDHSKTTWRPSQNNSTIPRITLWMTYQSHSTWNTSHMAQMTQKVTIIYRIFARDTRHRTVIYVYISQESL